MSMYGNGSAKPKVVCGASRVKQSFREQADVNSIIEKHARTGMIDNVNRKQPFYGDVSEIKSYGEAVEVVKKAEGLWLQMSSVIREKFHQNPLAMINWLADPKNLDEAIKLGMVIKRPVEPSIPTAPPAEPK